MSFLAKRPNLPQTTTAATANQIPTFQGAVPMTLAYGRIPYEGAHWLCDAFNRHTQKAGANKPDWQYASIAASFGIGPMDFVGKVRLNGLEIANLDHIRTTEDYIDYNFNRSLASGEAFSMRFYFGTETQTADTYLRTGTGQTHPPYRGQAYAVFHNLDLGQGSTSIPQIEIECGRKTPAVGSFSAGFSHPYGVNPIAAIYGLFTSDLGGLAVDSGLLDPTFWGNQAAALESTGIARRTGALTYLHAVLASFTDAASAASEWLTYFDGYIRSRSGKLEIAWFPHANVDPSTLPQILEADLTAKPSGGGFPDANAGLSDTVVTYLDFVREYTQQGASYRAPANRRTQVAGSPQQIDRPGCHAADQAAQLAAEASASGTQQDVGSTLTVLRSRAVNLDGSPLMPGDLFNFDYDPEALDIVCRVTERIETDPASPVQLTVIRERGSFPTPHTPPVDARVLPTEDAPGEVVTADVRLWLLPAGFGSARQVAALIDRHTRSDVGALMSMSPAGSAPWQQILDQRFFPAKCAVTNGGINNVATTVRVVSTSLDFTRMQAQNAVAQVDDTLLILIDDELLSVSTITSVATNTYDLGVIRGRQETVAAAHADTTVAWLFYRSELQAIENEEFYRVRDITNTYDATIATKHFKLALFTVDQVGNAKPNDPGLSLVLPDLSADDTLGYTVVITNEAHSVACDNTGTPLAGELGSGGLAKSTVVVYRGSTALTAVASGGNSDQFSIALGTLTNTTATKETNDTVRCDTLTANTGTIAIDVLVAGVFTVRKIFSLSKAKTGATGAGGATGATGATGAVGPGLVYVGAYNGANTYYCTGSRVDVVSSGGNYYRATNAAKSGLNTWGAPGGGDWSAADATYKFVATDLLLAQDVTILKTLVMGDGVTANAGIIRSSGATAYGTGVGFWLGYVGTTPKFRVGDPAASFFGYDGTVLTAAFGGSTARFTLDIDPGFIGANPPARLTFGGIAMNASASDTSTMTMSRGGLIFPPRASTSDIGFVIFAGDQTILNGFSAFGAGINQRTGESWWKKLSVTGDVIVPGRVGVAGGIKYDNGATNYIAFYWDGSNVRAVVDGTLQGTIPNP